MWSPLETFLRQNWHTTRVAVKLTPSRVGDFLKRKEQLMCWAMKEFPKIPEKEIAETIDDMYPYPKGWVYGYPKTPTGKHYD